MAIIHTGGVVVSATSHLLTGTSGLNARSMTITSELEHTTGYLRGLYVNITQSVSHDITSAGEINGIGVDITTLSDVPYLYGISLYTAQTGNPTIGFVAPISVYMSNMGTAVGSLAACDLGIDQSGGDPSGRFTFFRCRSHNATYMPHYIFMFEGANAAERFAYFEAGGASNMISAHSSGTTPQYNLKVYIEGVGERFIKIYDAA